jgi:hypothetical protein
MFRLTPSFPVIASAEFPGHCERSEAIFWSVLIPREIAASLVGLAMT